MQWTDINAAYTGCMASKVQRWNEARKRQVVLPQHTDRDLIGSQYPAFAHLDAFAVAGSVAEVALVPNKHNLRQLEHEGAHTTTATLTRTFNTLDHPC